MTPVNALGSGQAQVLAAVLHRAPNGPVSIIDIARDLGIRTTTVRRHLARLAAWGLVHPHVDERHVTPLVRPMTLEQAAAAAERVYDDERRAALRQQDDPSSTSDPLRLDRTGND